MGIKLTFEITSPLGPEDRDLLTGVAMMTLAIANHEAAQEQFPGAFPPDEEQQEEPEAVPRPCGAVGKGADEGKICVNYVGHKGRHRLRIMHMGGVN